jgi:hypothetical protein
MMTDRRIMGKCAGATGLGRAESVVRTCEYERLSGGLGRCPTIESNELEASNVSRSSACHM